VEAQLNGVLVGENKMQEAAWKQRRGGCTQVVVS